MIHVTTEYKYKFTICLCSFEFAIADVTNENVSLKLLSRSLTVSITFNIEDLHSRILAFIRMEERNCITLIYYEKRYTYICFFV